VPARLINIKYITIRAEKVASPVTALQPTLTEIDLTARIKPAQIWSKFYYYYIRLTAFLQDNLGKPAAER